VVVGVTRPTNCTVNGGPCDTFAPLAGVPRRSDAAATRLAYRELPARRPPVIAAVADWLPGDRNRRRAQLPRHVVAAIVPREDFRSCPTV
jgi:hypothetical protein